MVVQVEDPLNPTAADIRQWAADPDALCPTEDWDLVITGVGFEDLFLELVEDRECPNADFFLHCLYLRVYDVVRIRGKTAELDRLLRRAETSSEPALRRWARRSRALIADPRRAAKHIWWGFGQKRSGA
jgi:hypothetical protein